MSQYNVMVSSIGGDLGKAICKALRFSTYDIEVIGTDCKAYVPYSLFCDRFEIIPRAEGKIYTEFLNDFVLKNAIDLIYVCSEQELFYICDNFNDISEEIRYRFVIQPTNVINICRDKYKTMEFLKENNFPFPNSMLYDKNKAPEELLNRFDFPFVVKKITDCGSKHLHIIENRKDFDNINDINDTFMLQEYINGTEYTNAVYRDVFSNEIYVITLERTLKDGMSGEVKVVFNDEIQNLCIEIVKKLGSVGSINIQLRKQEGLAPVIFEINPRYSSTSFMRARFGFNDVIYAFENIVLKKEINKPQIIQGEAYRYISEYYKFYN